jgi:hypothetical protein
MPEKNETRNGAAPHSIENLIRKERDSSFLQTMEQKYSRVGSIAIKND